MTVNTTSENIEQAEKQERMKLINHRQIIERSPFAYTKDLEGDRLVGTLINHIKDDFKQVRFISDKK